MGFRDWLRRMQTRRAEKKARRMHFKELRYYERSLIDEAKRVADSPRLTDEQKRERLQRIEQERRRIQKMKEEQ